MAKDKETPDQEAGEEGGQPAAGGSKKKLFIIIGIAVAVLALGGGGAAFFLMGGKKTAPAAGEHGAEAKPEAGGHAAPAEETKKPEGEPAPAAEAHGGGGGGNDKVAKLAPAATTGPSEATIVDITGGKSMIVNLRNPLENHAVKVAVSVQIKDTPDRKFARVLTVERNALFRDAIISVVSARSRESLLSPDGKDSLRRELQNRFNQYMTNSSPVIEEVFITDFFIE